MGAAPAFASVSEAIEMARAALGDLVRLCVELDARRDGARDAAWAALEQAVIGKTMNLLVHFENLP